MNVKDYMDCIAQSTATDWIIIFHPTFLHRFTPISVGEDVVTRYDSDQHLAKFTYRPDISLTMAYGMVETGSYILPDTNPFAQENARTAYVDCFHDRQLVHRETVIKVDRQRCILPMPSSWAPGEQTVPEAKYNLVKLIHTLAGPPTDFESYFEEAGMEVVKELWP